MGYRLSMANKPVDKPFRELHETLTEWTCGYCKQAATTVRQGVAVCSHHKHLWAVGRQPPVTLEAPPNH